MKPVLIFWLALILELVVVALSPFLYLKRPRARWAAFIGLAAFTGVFLGSLLLVAGDFQQRGVFFSFSAAAAVILALENYYFRRLILVEASTGIEASRQILLQKTGEIEKLRKRLGELKAGLSQEESRLQEALKFYNIAWDLAECLGFEQMERVLERELKNTMPSISGFAVFIRNEQNLGFESRIRHRMWLEGEQWAHPEGKIFIGEVSGAVFYKDTSGKKMVVAPIAMGAKLLGYFACDVTLAPSRLIIGPPESNEMLQFAATLAEELKFGILRAINFDKVERLSFVDSLTGLYRRGMFDQRIREELVRSRVFKTSVCLVMLDIDHFKALNDQWGHLFGDLVLKKVAGVIARSVYETDFVARYGGEEFAVILPRADEEGALRKAEIIRQTVEREVFLSDDRSHKVQCTISIGLAFYPRDANNAEALIACADQALYLSKSAGRNRVTTFVSLAPRGQ